MNVTNQPLYLLYETRGMALRANYGEKMIIVGPWSAANDKRKKLNAACMLEPTCWNQHFSILLHATERTESQSPGHNNI
jgi:hypothetical protein